MLTTNKPFIKNGGIFLSYKAIGHAIISHATDSMDVWPNINHEIMIASVKSPIKLWNLTLITSCNSNNYAIKFICTNPLLVRTGLNSIILITSQPAFEDAWKYGI